MSIQVATVRKAGQKLPEAYSKILLERCPGAMGLAMPDGETSIVVHRAGPDIDIASFLKSAEENTSKLFLWATSEEAPLPEDLQPFTLVDNGEEGDDKAAVLACIIDADLPDSYNMTDETAKTPAYFFKELFLQPLIDELIEQAGDGGYERLIALLSSKEVRGKIQAELGPRGICMLIPVSGEAIAVISKDFTGHQEEDWGFSSRTFAGKKPASISMKPKGTAEKQEPEKEKPPFDTETPAEERYAKLLSNDKHFKIHNSLLYAGPAPGAPIKEARATWARNCTDPLPKKGETIDSSALYLGWPFSAMKAGSPLYESYSKHMGEKKQPAQAESEQGPSVPEKKERQEPEKLPPSLMIPKEVKATYLRLKGEGHFVATTLEKLESQVKEYPEAHVQLQESENTFLDMSTDGLARLPGSIKNVLLQDWRCRIKGLRGKAVEKSALVEKPKITMQRKTA